MKLQTMQPSDVFVPGHDPGFALLAPQPRPWRAITPAWISGVALSRFEDQNTRARGMLRNFHRIGSFSRALEFRTVLACVDDLEIRKSTRATIGGKLFLNANHGLRQRNRMAWQRGESGRDFDREVMDYLQEIAARPSQQRPLPVSSDANLQQLDLVVECRNGFNYYHFVTETFCHLCLAEEAGLSGRVRIHAAGRKQAGFLRAWIDHLFPALSPRVDILMDTRARYDRALVAYGLQTQYFMSGDGMVPPIDEFVPKSWIWKGRRAERNAYGLITQNACDRNLRQLRARGLKALKQAPPRDLPRRIWVSRDPTTAHRRPMAQEKRLERRLAGLGFTRISFDGMSPADQIAHMHAAEVVVMAHGAGLTNMLYARPDALIVELSNVQTLDGRFGDFNQYAHVAGCRYLTVICDHNTDDPDKVPDMTEDGHAGVSVSREAIERLRNLIAAFVDLQKVQDVPGTAALLREAGAEDVLRDLLLAYDRVTRRSAELLVWRANTHAARGDDALTLRDLQAVWAMDPTRPVVLERIIRLLNRLGDQAQARPLMQHHARHFPARASGFLEQNPWLAHLLREKP